MNVTLNPKKGMPKGKIKIHKKSSKSLQHSKKKYRFSLHSMVHSKFTWVMLTVVLVSFHSKVKFES